MGLFPATTPFRNPTVFCYALLPLVVSLLSPILSCFSYLPLRPSSTSLDFNVICFRTTTPLPYIYNLFCYPTFPSAISRHHYHFPVQFLSFSFPKYYTLLHLLLLPFSGYILTVFALIILFSLFLPYTSSHNFLLCLSAFSIPVCSPS